MAIMNNGSVRICRVFHTEIGSIIAASWKRLNFPLVVAECKAVSKAAGLLDITGFARYRITGPNAAKWLDKLLACRIPERGKIKLAPMLAENGKLKGDLTLFNWDGDEFWLMGSYYLRAFHKRWFDLHMEDGVHLEDVSDAITGFSVSGPKAAAILQSLAEIDLSDIKMMNCTTCDLGIHRVRLARLSLSGEVAFEVSCTATEHVEDVEDSCGGSRVERVRSSQH